MYRGSAIALLLAAASSMMIGAAPKSAPSPMGGANAAKTQDGCPGKPLFNGVVRFIAGTPVKQNDGDYRIKLTFKNATADPIQLQQVGITVDLVRLAYGPDDVRAPQNYFTPDGGGASPTLTYFTTILPGMGETFFISSPGTAPMPSKLIVLVNKKAAKGVRFSVPDPGFRVRFDCTTEPSPAAS